MVRLRTAPIDPMVARKEHAAMKTQAGMSGETLNGSKVEVRLELRLEGGLERKTKTNIKELAKNFGLFGLRKVSFYIQ